MTSELHKLTDEEFTKAHADAIADVVRGSQAATMRIHGYMAEHARRQADRDDRRNETMKVLALVATVAACVAAVLALASLIVSIKSSSIQPDNGRRLGGVQVNVDEGVGDPYAGEADGHAGAQDAVPSP